MTPLYDLGFDFLALLMAACGYFFLCWLIARKLDNWSIVDVAWSYGFALVGLKLLYVHFYDKPLGGQGLLMSLATMVWSLRLGTHLAVRVLGHLDKEDGRYLQMRAEAGARMPWQMAYFYFLQALALALLCLPLLSSSPYGAPSPIGPIHWIGLVIVALALVIEGMADAQLADFKKDVTQKGKVCERGLWAWSRHPNYFGEWLVWVGFVLMSYNATYRGIPGLVCALIMYHLLTRVTGVALTERQLVASKGDAYVDYQRRVSAFWPRPPRP